uniref:Uncharacterized protein n=1 Tax=Rhizophora mucronata TaxID=61149 RepID=A0A2P2NJ42_RHIMU
MSFLICLLAYRLN